MIHKEKAQALAALGIAAPLKDGVARVCATCPFLIANHGKPHPAKWYSRGNIRRLWNGLRTGDAPGMICHSSDHNNAEYGGKGNVKPGVEQDCAGALLLLYQNANAVAAGRPQPFQPPLTKATLANLALKLLLGALPEVEDRSAEIGLPWIIRRKRNR
jgi:hypothetical protein